MNYFEESLKLHEKLAWKISTENKLKLINTKNNKQK